MNIIWGMEILWIFFWGHHKIGLVFRVISMHLWVLWLRYRIGIFFDVAKISNIFFGVLDIPDIFGGKQ